MRTKLILEYLEAIANEHGYNATFTKFTTKAVKVKKIEKSPFYDDAKRLVERYCEYQSFKTKPSSKNIGDGIKACIKILESGEASLQELKEIVENAKIIMNDESRFANGSYQPYNFFGRKKKWAEPMFKPIASQKAIKEEIDNTVPYGDF